MEKSQHVFDVCGAQGGSGYLDGVIKSQGGLGAHVKATLNVTGTGTLFYAYVGEQGSSSQYGPNKGGLNGGGKSGKGTEILKGDAAGGGGGATDVRISNKFTKSSPFTHSSLFTNSLTFSQEHHSHQSTTPSESDSAFPISSCFTESSVFNIDVNLIQPKSAKHKAKQLWWIAFVVGVALIAVIIFLIISKKRREKKEVEISAQEINDHILNYAQNENGHSDDDFFSVDNPLFDTNDGTIDPFSKDFDEQDL